MFPCALKGLPSGRQVRLDSTPVPRTRHQSDRRKGLKHPYPLDWGGRGIYVRYILASKIPENMPSTFFQAILGKMYRTYFEVSMVHLKENVHVHFSGIRSSSLKMYMVHFEVQPKDFREHQGIRWNMENDGIKWNIVEYGSCLKHFGSCDDLKSVKT